ncbi:MAG: FtsW/RodA/SpoVE family cell cycle protein [Actinobacteria bacterium]|nr:FtsW/RodA/SpoVE family cell cycle protein [Actinomycetota bacterium]
MACVFAAGAYALAYDSPRTDMSLARLPLMLTVLALWGLAHLVVRRVANGADALLLPVVAVLHGTGFVMIARLANKWADLQTVWSVVGVGAFLAVLVLVDRPLDLRRWQWTCLGAGLVLLVLPMVPGLGFTSGGARIWVSIGPINFQPGEFAKILLAVFFAAYLDERRTLIVQSEHRLWGLNLPEMRHLAPIAVAWGLSVLVMVGQRDLGSSLMFFSLFVVMLWVATEKTGYLVVGSALFLAGATAAYFLFDHVRSRVEVWLDPWSRFTDRGYQPVKALFGMANGGLWGEGLGNGQPSAIPAAHNDFIFAAIGEELGMMGAAAVLAAYVLLVGAGMRVALRAQRDFEKLLAVGLTTILAVQTFVIIGGVLRVVPLTGVTLPFMSYGGSSLVSNYVVLALLVRMSDATARELREVPSIPGVRERVAMRLAQRRETRR